MGLFDYGSDNLHSTAQALAAVEGRVMLIGDIRELKGCNALVVSGVGAYAACIAGLWAVGGAEPLADQLPTGKPLLDICMEHQILFEEGIEYGICTAGFGLRPGAVRPLAARRFPHIGWNRVDVPPGSRLFVGAKDKRFYFVHSHAATRMPGADGTLVTIATHEAPFVAAVERGNVCSTRLRPEKSREADARLLRN